MKRDALLSQFNLMEGLDPLEKLVVIEDDLKARLIRSKDEADQGVLRSQLRAVREAKKEIYRTRRKLERASRKDSYD